MPGLRGNDAHDHLGGAENEAGEHHATDDPGTVLPRATQRAGRGGHDHQRRQGRQQETDPIQRAVGPAGQVVGDRARADRLPEAEAGVLVGRLVDELCERRRDEQQDRGAREQQQPPVAGRERRGRRVLAACSPGRRRRHEQA
jgi:hypothetical protein